MVGVIMDQPSRGILTICETLHMSKTGAADPLSEAQVKWYIDFLKNKLEKWVVYPNHLRYDEAVRALIVATLNEYK
jgi:hypothetical protein